MKTRSMDDERISINNIKNIESIKFSDFGVSSIGNNKTSLYKELIGDGNSLIIPMLIVVYDGGNVIILTAKEKNFNYLVKKTRDVYLKEKDKVIEGDFFKKGIDIDEQSKKILLSDTTLQTSELYKHYKDIESYDKKLISIDKEVNSLLPLIEYIINTNLNNIGKNFKLENRLNGYGPSGNYTLYGEIDGIYQVIPILITKGNNSYNIQIANVFDRLKPLDVTINFNKTSLDIITKVDELNYYMLESFTYNGSLTNTKEIYVGETCVYSDPVEIKKDTSIPNLSKIDEDDNLDWFKMPWGASLGFSNVDNRLDNECKTSYRKVQYIGTNNNSFVNIESAEKRFIRKTKDFRKAKDIIYDDVDKIMIGFSDSNMTYIETSFSDDGAVGEYKESFANKYFYQVSNTTNFDEINKTNTYPVKREYDVYHPGELINNYKIKKLLKENK